MKYVIISPAYGRDYSSSKAAVAALKAGKDFILHDPHSPWNGKPCSMRDFPAPTIFRIRYNQMRRICTHTQEITDEQV